MSGFLVVVPAGVGPVQIDDFPEGCERSRKGALHLRPGSTETLTAAELEHLKAKHAMIADRLRTVDTTVAKPAAAPVALSEPVVVEEPAPTVAPEPEKPAPVSRSERRGRSRSRGSE